MRRAVVLGRTTASIQYRPGDPGARPAAPGPGQLRVRVECSGLANANVMMVRGEYPGGPRGPWSPGYDVVGTVDAVGAGVEEFAVGERVAVLTKWGGCQQFLAWPAGKSVVKVPAGCEDSAKAVSVVLNGVTALQMLERTAGLEAGQTALVHGLAGGMGSMLALLCRAKSIRVIGTASAGKHEVCRRLGAEPLDYNNEDWSARVLALTEGRGVDAVFDSVGGDYVAKSLRCLKKSGTYVNYGLNASSPQHGGRFGGVLTTAAGFAAGLLKAALFVGPRVRTYFIGLTYSDTKIKEDLARLLDMLAAGELDPPIHRVYPLERCREAMEAIEQHAAVGKVVVDLR